jgi:hypothetical protein
MTWAVEDVSFEIARELTDGPVVTVMVATPGGNLVFMGEPGMVGNWAVLRRTHVQGSQPNGVGMANLMVIAQAIIEGVGLDGLIVDGALRTTGAGQGHRPRTFRFPRRVRPASAGAIAEPAVD